MKGDILKKEKRERQDKDDIIGIKDIAKITEEMAEKYMKMITKEIQTEIEC